MAQNQLLRADEFQFAPAGAQAIVLRIFRVMREEIGHAAQYIPRVAGIKAGPHGTFRGILAYIWEAKVRGGTRLEASEETG